MTIILTESELDSYGKRYIGRAQLRARRQFNLGARFAGAIEI